ncbi:hypothetical protein EV421DRAFT_1914875 [Armillaria borealis]|uniref:Uncharacterized protein n=1 Tax=Armillaria borealis TaxID=47425 RepID=A0AA39ICJ0_9AGAR|nr:hypothetical protein EV421DRAFT_1914875 [Armillaria borealis]
MDTQYVDATSERLSIPSGHERTACFHDLHSSILILNCKEFSKILVHRALREYQFPKVPMASCSSNYLIAMPENKFEYFRGIRRLSRREVPCNLILESISFPGFPAYSHLRMMADDAVIKQESKRLLTHHPHSVAFNTISSKRSLPEKSKHNQLNQGVRLINSLDIVPRDHFITSMAVSSGFISGHAETNFLACSISLAPTAPLSKVDTKVVGHKRGIIGESGSEVKDTETRIQGYQRLATISSADEAIVDESNKRRNDGNHHQYRSSFGNTFSASESAAFPLDRHAKLPPASHERQRDSPFCGDHFEFTVEIILEHSSADSLALLGQVPNPDFQLILTRLATTSLTFPQTMTSPFIRKGFGTNYTSTCLKF